MTKIERWGAQDGDQAVRWIPVRQAGDHGLAHGGHRDVGLDRPGQRRPGIVRGGLIEAGEQLDDLDTGRQGPPDLACTVDDRQARRLSRSRRSRRRPAVLIRGLAGLLISASVIGSSGPSRRDGGGCPSPTTGTGRRPRSGRRRPGRSRVQAPRAGPRPGGAGPKPGVWAVSRMNAGPSANRAAQVASRPGRSSASRQGCAARAVTVGRRIEDHARISMSPAQLPLGEGRRVIADPADRRVGQVVQLGVAAGQATAGREASTWVIAAPRRAPAKVLAPV